VGVRRRGPPLEGRGLARVGRYFRDGALSSLLRLGLDLFQSDQPLRRRVEGEPDPSELAVAQGPHLDDGLLQILGVARVALAIHKSHVLFE
jgi:hypothetical protein